jgi:hypothetical protein
LARPERLEYALIVSALRREGAQLEPALDLRIRESFETFTERFPESHLMQAYEVDPDDPMGALLEVLPRTGRPPSRAA